MNRKCIIRKIIKLAHQKMDVQPDLKVVPTVIFDNGRSRLWTVPNYTSDFYPLLKDLPLQVNPPIVVFGKPGIQHRDVGFYSDIVPGYPYSGQFMPARPLNDCPFFPTLLKAINQSIGIQANAILVNRYNDGKTGYLLQHSDDKIHLDPNNSMVASLAYGAARIFRITDKKSNQKVFDYIHQPRSLLVMDGDFQDEFKHGIPKQSKVTESRISLTFRTHRL